MFKLRAVVLGGVALVALLAVLFGGGLARADGDSGANVCDVQGLWGGSFTGTLLGDQGVVVFNIYNQRPPAASDDDGSADYALASQLANGLGNAGEGEKYHFLFTTTLVTNQAVAQGHGFLFVMGSEAMFVIAGHGDHPLYGPFKLTAEGSISCVNGQGTFGDATFHLRFTNGMSDDGAVGLAKCESAENCPPEEL
jgi:hypothetical protein